MIGLLDVKMQMEVLPESKTTSCSMCACHGDIETHRLLLLPQSFRQQQLLKQAVCSAQQRTIVLSVSCRHL
jgi:hypothetical protein